MTVPAQRRVPDATGPRWTSGAHPRPSGTGAAVGEEDRHPTGSTAAWTLPARWLRSASRTGASTVAAGAALTRSVARPAGMLGLLVEGAWVATHLALYPVGAVGRRTSHARQGYRTEHLGPTQRGLLVGDVEAAGTPILLVHGMGDNRSVFTLLRRGLRRRGFGRVSTLNYSPLTSDVRTAAVRLAEEVDRLVEETGYERIHVVGHSLGGLVARYYVTRLGGDERVHTLVTLGTPHSGTVLARLCPSRLCRQLTPGSPLMRELAQPAPGCRTRIIAYWSDVDYAVVPPHHAMVEHPDIEGHNVGLVGVGHMSLPILPVVLRRIAADLAVLDADGSTVTEGTARLRDEQTAIGG